MPRPTPEQRARYYRAAVIGLRALDAADGSGRRFGPDADARWERFKGALHTGDRLEVLVRDAAVPWPPAFSASAVFRLEGVATDEPFGPRWTFTNEGEAARYLATPGEPDLKTAAETLGISDNPVHLPDIGPATRLVVAGGAAVLAVAQAFAGRSDLDWSAQVTVVADDPAVRQLAGLAGLFVGALRPCRVLASDEAAAASLTGRGVASDDAEPGCAVLLPR